MIKKLKESFPYEKISLTKTLFLLKRDAKQFFINTHFE